MCESVCLLISKACLFAPRVLHFSAFIVRVVVRDYIVYQYSNYGSHIVRFLTFYCTKFAYITPQYECTLFTNKLPNILVLNHWFLQSFVYESIQVIEFQELTCPCMDRSCFCGFPKKEIFTQILIITCKYYTVLCGCCSDCGWCWPLEFKSWLWAVATEFTVLPATLAATAAAWPYRASSSALFRAWAASSSEMCCVQESLTVEKSFRMRYSFRSDTILDRLSAART